MQHNVCYRKFLTDVNTGETVMLGVEQQKASRINSKNTYTSSASPEIFYVFDFFSVFSEVLGV